MLGHKKTTCVLCILTPIILSGFIGYLAGSYSRYLGFDANAASTLAGFAGFMGAQAFNYACLLLVTRYHRCMVVRRRAHVAK